MRQYLRQARLTIAPPGLAIDESLRLAFEVRTAAQDKPPPSTITVTNLAESTAAQMVTPATVRLSAGYVGHPLDQLFVGEIARIDQGFEDRDRLTTLTLGPTGRQGRTTAIISTAYQGVVALRTVVADIAARMGLPVVSLDAVPDLTVADYVHTGRPEDALTGLLRPRGVEWYEAGGELQFRRRGVPDARRGFVLNERTGMIGSPERTEKGARAQMRLNALVRLNQQVRIDSQRLSGTYKVITIGHVGDTWDGPWMTEIEAVTL